MEKLKQLCIRRHAMAHVMKKKGCNGHTELAEELGESDTLQVPQRNSTHTLRF